MSTTLTWFNSGNGTKTGTAIGNLFADIVTLANAVSPGSDYKWEVKGSNTGSTPYYISFGRKDGSAGRIALLAWSSAPAGNNSAILDQAPATNTLYIAYFPAGTGTTLANLAASSGAITGDDTNCVKVSAATTVATLYAANFVPWYFESNDVMAFGFQNPASPGGYWLGAGECLVDFSDTAYGGTFGYSTTSILNFGVPSASPMPWSSSSISAGASGASVRTNYGSANRTYYHAYIPTSSQSLAAAAATSMLINTSTKDIYWAPVQLLAASEAASARNEGIKLKFRQIAWGAGSTSAFQAYTDAGAAVLARHFTNATSGGASYPWFVNDKV